MKAVPYADARRKLMSTNFASLGISIESSQAAKAADDLDKLVDSAVDAEKAIDDLGKTGEGLANTGKKITQAESEVTQGVDKSTAAIDRKTGASRKAADSAVAEINVISQLDRAMTGNITSMESLIQAEGLLERARKGGLVTIEEQAKYQEQLGKAFDKIEKAEAKELAQKQRLIEAENRQIEALKRTVNGIDPVTAKLAKLEAQEKAAHEAFRVGAIDVEAYNAALAKVGKDRAGITEVGGAFDKLKLGTRQAQENVMQLSNAIQSGDWGSGARAIAQLGAGAGESAGRMISLAAPVALVTAAIGTLAAAYLQGVDRAEKFNTALIVSGGAAGKTTAQLTAMSLALGKGGNLTQASEALLAVASSGELTGSTFDSVARAATELSVATGRSSGEIAKQMVSSKGDVAALAAEYNRQYHFMNSETYSHIKVLQEQGDEMGALELLTTQLADSMAKRNKDIEDSARGVVGAWRDAKKAFSDYWGEFTSRAGADKDTFTLQVKQGQLEDVKALPESNLRTKAIANLEQEISLIQQRIGAKQKDAEQDAKTDEKTQKGIDAERDLEVIRKAAYTNKQKRDKEEEKYLQKIADLREANPKSPLLDQKLIDRDLDNIRNKYKDPKAASTQVDMTSFNNAKNNLSDIVTDYRNAQKELEAQQKAGVVSLSDYAKQRSALINQEKDDVTAAYQAEIDALEATKAKKGTSAAQSIQIDQKIADARQGMVKAQKDADSQLTVIATNEKGRLEQLTAASEAYVNQLERQRAALAAAGSRAANGLGLGDRQAGLQASLDATTDKFNDERAKLLDRRKTAPDKYSQEDYMRDLASLEDAERKYRATVVDNYDQMSEAQGNWRSGASSAFQNYLQSANDVAGQTKSLFTNAFSSMEDAVANFATTGKLSFSDFTKSIIADMARIATRQAASGLLSSIAGSALGAYFGGGAATGAGSFGSSIGTAITANAKGGVYDSPSLSSFSNQVHDKPQMFAFAKGAGIFAEAGPEAIMPLTRTAGGELGVRALGGGGGGGGAGGNTYNFPVSVSVQTAGDGGNATQEDTTQLGKGIQQAAKTEAETAIAKGLQPGGSIWRLINGR